MERDPEPSLPDKPGKILLWISLHPCWGFSGLSSSSFPPDRCHQDEAAAGDFSRPEKASPKLQLKAAIWEHKTPHFRGWRSGSGGRNQAGGNGAGSGHPKSHPHGPARRGPQSPSNFPQKWLTVVGTVLVLPGGRGGIELRVAAAGESSSSKFGGGNFPFRVLSEERNLRSRKRNGRERRLRSELGKAPGRAMEAPGGSWGPRVGSSRCLSFPSRLIPAR